MKIIAFFLRHSRKIVFLSIAAGALSGMCNAALLAVINSILKTGVPGWRLVWSFVGLCMLLPFSRFTSERLLTKLGQEAMHRMRMQLCRQILAAPLLHLEQLGSARLLTTLTDDIPVITNAVLRHSSTLCKCGARNRLPYLPGHLVLGGTPHRSGVHDPGDSNLPGSHH